MSKDYKARLIIGFIIHDPHGFMKKFMKVTEPVFETHAQFCPTTGAQLLDVTFCASPRTEYWSLDGLGRHFTLNSAIAALLELVGARGDISNGSLCIYPLEMSGDDCSFSCPVALLLMEKAKRIGQSLKDMGLEPGEPTVRAVHTW